MDYELDMTSDAYLPLGNRAIRLADIRSITRTGPSSCRVEYCGSLPSGGESFAGVHAERLMAAFEAATGVHLSDPQSTISA